MSIYKRLIGGLRLSGLPRLSIKPSCGGTCLTEREYLLFKKETENVRES